MIGSHDELEVMRIIANESNYIFKNPTTDRYKLT